jgi:protein phosphatase 2C family protein 2/3
LSNIKQIAGGGYKHSAVLHDNGDIFVMGSDDFGQCGPVVESVEEDKSLAGVFVFSEEGEGTSMQLPTTYLACGTDSSSKWEVGIAITQGLRESQEDYIVYVNETNPASADKSSFIAVYDGHGGSAVSGFLSRHLHKNYVAELATHTVPATAFASAYSKTDAYLAEKDLPFTGSTSVTCHLTNSDHDGTTAHCANAGDSYAVLATKLKGSKTDAWSFRKLSEDHRPTNRLETIRIESLGGKVVNGRVSGP